MPDREKKIETRAQTTAEPGDKVDRLDRSIVKRENTPLMSHISNVVLLPKNSWSCLNSSVIH